MKVSTSKNYPLSFVPNRHSQPYKWDEIILSGVSLPSIRSSVSPAILRRVMCRLLGTTGKFSKCTKLIASAFQSHLKQTSYMRRRTSTPAPLFFPLFHTSQRSSCHALRNLFLRPHQQWGVVSTASRDDNRGFGAPVVTTTMINPSSKHPSTFCLAT